LAGSGAVIVDYYEELEKRGISLQYQFYKYQPGTPYVLNYFYLRYAERYPRSEEALRNLLLASVECKDFVLLRRLYHTHGENGEKYAFVTDTWKMAERLLSTIQECIAKRRQKDIFVVWTDAVGYDDMVNYMPFVKQLSRQGLYFPWSYPSTPYTKPVLRTIFSGTWVIDDYELSQRIIGKENSALIRYLEEKNYEIKFSGEYRTVFPEEYLTGDAEYSSSTLKWWNALLSLLRTSKPCFYIIHCLTESHAPMFSPDLLSLYNMNIISDIPGQLQQKQTALNYLDQCLAIYHRLLGDTVQIYLSDHGNDLHLYSRVHWAETRLHTYSFVVGKGIPQRTFLQFFPYQNFLRLVQALLEPEKYSVENACTEEVVFQDVDFYNPNMIKTAINQGHPEVALAFRGVLNVQYKYVLNTLGEEFFYLRQKDGTEVSTKLTDDTLRQKFRQKCGTKFLDIRQIEKFQSSRIVYECILKHGNTRESEERPNGCANSVRE